MRSLQNIINFMRDYFALLSDAIMTYCAVCVNKSEILVASLSIHKFLDIFLDIGYAKSYPILLESIVIQTMMVDQSLLIQNA